MPSSFVFTLMVTHLVVFVAEDWLLGGLGEEENTVRNRDTCLRLIETSQNI
jgi:hypothetical protein